MLEITLLHKSGGVYQQEWFKIILVHYPGLLPPIRRDSNISWLMLKSRRMRMDACPLSTDRRVSSINATWTAPVPCPGFNPDCARLKDSPLAGIVQAALWLESAGNFLAVRRTLGYWFGRTHVHRVDFLRARWQSIPNMSVIPNSPVGVPHLPSSRFGPSGMGSGTILGRWQHEEARQHCQVKSRTRMSSEV